MAGEQQVQDVNNEVESDETDADFLAGVAAHAEQPTATPAPTPQPSPAPTPEPSPEPTPEPTPEPKYVQITEEQWKALSDKAAKIDQVEQSTAKQLKTAFGKMGSFEDVLKKLQTETPAGESVEIAEEDFAEFKEQYPELAEIQLKALNKALGKFKGTGPEAIEKIVAHRFEEVTTRVNQTSKDVLAVVFPDWESDVKTPEFLQWMAGQPEDVRALAASDKASEAAKLLRKFYAAKEAPAATPAPTPAATPVPVRKRQIAAAVPPKGDGGAPPSRSEDDDFLEGLRSVQQR